MFNKPTTAKTISEYMALLPPERREHMESVHFFIQKHAPGLEPWFVYNMIGYGSFKYRNSKKELVDWPVISLASQKNYISIYVCSIKDGKYLAESYAHKLGKVSVGKSCIRFKKIDDVDLDVLGSVIDQAAAKPGLPQASL